MESQGPQASDIDGFLAWDLVRLGHGVETRLAAAMAEYGLTTRQFGVLALLHAHDDLAQSDLARAVLIRPQSVSALVASLAQRQLVERVGPGGRGRRTSLRLTEAGRHLIAESWAGVTTDNARAALGFSQADADALRRILPGALDRLGRPGALALPR